MVGRAWLLLLLLAGCRDYDRFGRLPRDLAAGDDLAMNAPDDLAAPDGAVADGGARDGSSSGDASADAAPACVSRVYDRDAGTPDAAPIQPSGEVSAAIPLSAPQGTQRFPGRVSAGDTDGDGHPDVMTLAPATAAGNGELALFHAGGSPGSPALSALWNTVLTGADVETTTELLVADFVPDEPAAQAGAPRAEVILAGDPAFNSSVSAPPYTHVGVYRVSNSSSGSLTPLFNATFDLGALVSPSPAARAVALRAGDLDGDGKLDLVVALDLTPLPQPSPLPLGGVAVIWGDAPVALAGLRPYAWQLDHASFLAGTVAQPIAAHPSRLVVADLDGDCRPEIAISGLDADGTGEQVSVISANPQRQLVVSQNLHLDTPPTGNGKLVAIDLARDGTRSLLVTEASTWRVISFPGGSVNVATVSAQPSHSLDCFAGDSTCVTGISGAVVADFDHDGAEDLVHWGFFLSASVPYTSALFYRNNSLGLLARSPDVGLAPRANPDEIVDSTVVDLDGDGNLEVAFVDANSAKVSFDPIRP